jgi:glutamate formiminotransferase
MSFKIVECVPNFSEGRDQRKINEVIKAVKEIKGVKLLDVSPDPDYNRTVITFIGSPNAVKKAAFNATKKAIEVIDLRKQKGEHPRLGAMDVVPFVAVKNVSMKECIQLARGLGKELGEKIGIPVYLYAEAALKPERKEMETRFWFK